MITKETARLTALLLTLCFRRDLGRFAVITLDGDVDMLRPGSMGDECLNERLKKAVIGVIY